MGNDKIRVLYTGNASYLSSGYATYSFEVLSRLYKTGLFELAELSQFGGYDDPRALDIPWKQYPVVPNPANPDEVAEYGAAPGNEYGAYKFERTCLDFRPDVCFGIDDWWASEFIFRSPLRRHCHLAYMPTVDAVPQMNQWVESYRSLDSAFTYTDWAAEVLRGYGVPVVGSAPPGADVEVFRPVRDRSAHKASQGLPGDCLVVGCFGPGTPVLMADYSLNSIENVQPGDWVITHKGRARKVVARHAFPADKPMVSVKVMGEPDAILCTSDHEVMAVRRAAVATSKTKGQKAQVYNPMAAAYIPSRHDHKWEPGWQQVGTLQRGDYWVFKIPDAVVPVESVQKDGVSITVTEDMLFLAGFYLAEGYIASSKDCPHHSVVWTVNEQDIGVLDKTLKAVRSVFGKEAGVEGPFDDKTYRVSVHSAKHARIWFDAFGHGAGGKKLPDWFATLEPAKQLVLVRGWQAGDGCQAKNRNIGISINLGMLQALRLALLRNGIVASLNKRDMSKAKGLYGNAKQQWRLVERQGHKHNNQFIYGGFLYCPVYSVDPVDATGVVYDLTVEEDESYSIYCKNVHNTVMRNQARKLFPDLVESFAEFTRTAPTGIRDRTFLYLHTAHPDMGWDIPRLILRAGVGDRTLLTYRCRACGHSFPSLLADAKAVCPRCREHAATMPGSSDGLSREQLASVYQLFDCFVQYSVCEGFGVPQVEAAACGVPVFAVDYSAMSDVVRKVGGFPVKVERFVTEAATERKLAYPSNADLVQQLGRYLAAPTAVKAKRERAAREGVLAHYTYDRTAKIWADHLLSVKPKRTWDEPPRLHEPNLNVPGGLTDEEFVRWAFAAVLGRPEQAHSLTALRLTRDLTNGTTFGFAGGSVYSDAAAHGKNMFTKLMPFDRDQLVSLMVGEVDRANHWELERCKSHGRAA